MTDSKKSILDSKYVKGALFVGSIFGFASLVWTVWKSPQAQALRTKVKSGGS